MKYLIGIDDTDNKESRGTGYRARKMASFIEEYNLGIVMGITRCFVWFSCKGYDTRVVRH